MISLLTKIFIRDKDNLTDPTVRRSYGMLCSITGIALNLLLFGFKYFAGVLSGSVSITADAFNNLSDAGSSIMTLIGFKFSGAKPDTNHPFGHGRIEYISGFIVSLVIVLMGFELLKTSYGKLINPTDVDTGPLALVILAVSIGVKLYMFCYNRRIGGKIDSPGMKATALDSLNDMITTSVVLLSAVIMVFTDINIDGWCGVAVSLFILWVGIKSAMGTLSPLLGNPPSPEYVQSIRDIVLAHDEIVGIHDLVVHDYGPGRVMISLHAEVPENGDIIKLHDIVDLSEHELKALLGCEAVIHMDPIAVDDESVVNTRRDVLALIQTIDDQITLHDFRMVKGPTHTNLIFDVVVPYRFSLSPSLLKEQIQALITEKWSTYFCVISVDTSYI